MAKRPLSQRIREAGRAFFGPGAGMSPSPGMAPAAGLAPEAARQLGLVGDDPQGLAELEAYFQSLQGATPGAQGYGRLGSPLGLIDPTQTPVGTDPARMAMMQTLPPEKWQADVATLGADARPMQSGPFPAAPNLSPTFRKLTANVLPSDIAGAKENPSETEREVVAHVQDCVLAWFKATERRRVEWAEAYRFYEADQWHGTKGSGALLDTGKGDEEIERRQTINFIKPIVTEVVSALTQNAPTVTVLPLLDSEKCAKAAEEGNIVNVHVSDEVDDRQAVPRQVMHSTITGIGWRICNWSPVKTALVPIPDGEGGYSAAMRQVGDVDEAVCGPGGVLVDPAADRTKDAGWVITRHVMPLSWVHQHYGRVGEIEADTKADASEADFVGAGEGTAKEGSLRASLFSAWTQAGARQGYGGSAGARYDAVTVWRYLERPSWRYPRGRHIIMGGGVILHNGIWPYERTDDFPVIPVVSSQPVSGLYPRSIISDCIQAQKIINKEWSRILARLDRDKRTILIQKLSGIAADAYQEQADLAKVYYEGGTQPPVMQSPPPINPQHFEAMDRAYNYIKEISGVIDALRGQNPTGATSAAQLELLQQAAATKFKTFIASIESAAVSTARWRIAHYAQFVREPRLIGLDDRDNPNPASRYGISALQALTSGGQVAVRVEPGSALPRSPQAVAVDLDNDYAAQRLGPPGAPETNLLYWQLSKRPYAQKVKDALEAQQEQAQAAQEAQMQAEQEAQAQQAQAMQAQQEQAQAVEGQKLALEAQKTQAQQAKLQGDMAMQERRAALEEARLQSEIEGRAQDADSQREVEIARQIVALAQSLLQSEGAKA